MIRLSPYCTILIFQTNALSSLKPEVLVLLATWVPAAAVPPPACALLAVPVPAHQAPAGRLPPPGDQTDCLHTVAVLLAHRPLTRPPGRAALLSWHHRRPRLPGYGLPTGSPPEPGRRGSPSHP